MLTLAKKVQQLKLTAYHAGKAALFLEGKIKEHGESKIEQFYLSLGHNHIDRKGFDWEGMTLSREPKEHEKIAVKGVSEAQESAKDSIGKILLGLRSELISDGLKAITKLEPAEYHTLTLQVPVKSRSELRDRLIKTHKQGRILVANELGNKDSLPDDEFDDLDLLTDVTGARVVNDVQARLIDAATRHTLLGQTGDGLILAVTNEINAGSVSYIDRASTGLANRVINIGRGDEARRRSSQWGRVEYSALLDKNVCGPCASEDGKEAENEDDLTSVPNPDCEGSDYCRCFHVFIQD